MKLEKGYLLSRNLIVSLNWNTQQLANEIHSSELKVKVEIFLEKIILYAFSDVIYRDDIVSCKNVDIINSNVGITSTS